MCYQQADTDTLRLRLHRQLAPPGSLSVLHLPTMAPVCCTPDASTLQRTARATLPNVCELRNSTFAIVIETTYKPVSINCKTSIP